MKHDIAHYLKDINPTLTANAQAHKPELFNEGVQHIQGYLDGRHEQKKEGPSR